MSGPRIAYVTAGGAGMFCGSCMRDNTLARELRDLGCDVVLLPTFTPIRTDEEDVSAHRIFLGGINLYLEARWSWFRRMPAFARHALNRPALLRLASRVTLQRRSEDDGRMALSLLLGNRGPHRREVDELTDWLVDELKPDLVNLTNLLIAGFVPQFKARCDVPVFVTLQGDDIFLDSLLPADRVRVIAEMRRVAEHVDGFIVFSRFYRDHMSRLFGIAPERFHLAPMGLSRPEAFAPERAPDPRPPTVGYLARICPEKGFDQLVEAFIGLRDRPGMQDARLHAAGWLSAHDRPFFDAQRRRLEAAGLGEAFDHIELPDLKAKVRYLSGLDVLSVPTRYREPKGIYVLEALAAGVPVIQPDHGAFPELLQATGGGLLVPPGDTPALVAALQALLSDPAHRRRLGAQGRETVCRDFTATGMARGTLKIWGFPGRP